MRLHCQLIAETPDSSLSVLTVAGEFLCFVLEDGYRPNKVAGQTRIPPGVYRIAKRTEGGFFDTYRRKYGHLFSIELLDVPGFQFILMHIGNTIGDTRGCLLVALGVDKNTNFALKKSTEAYLQLYEVVRLAFDRGEPVEIEISRERWMKGA